MRLPDAERWVLTSLVSMVTPSCMADGQVSQRGEVGVERRLSDPRRLRDETTPVGSLVLRYEQRV